jgi:hypothetical protein
LKVSYESVSGG